MGCPPGKTRYTDYDHAIEAVNIRLNIKGDQLRSLSAYHCPWCDGYHLTSQQLPQIAPNSRIHRLKTRTTRKTSKKRQKRDRKRT